MDRQVVLDAGPAIRLKQLHEFGAHIYTTAGVLQEVRQKRARAMITYLPCEVEVKCPTPQDVSFVRAFAKKTGDLGFLSQNDIDIIALTLMLQRETGEVAHLNKTPKTLTFDTASHRYDWAPSPALNTPEAPSLSSMAKPAASCRISAASCITSAASCSALASCTSALTSCSVRSSAARTRVDSFTCVSSSEGKDGASGVAGDLSHVADILQEASVEDDQDALSSDGSEAGEWVTSENIGRFHMSVESEKQEKVTCVTTDYSVQNVLMQIGLHVTSIDGYRIRNLKLWGLLCRACGTSTRDTSKLWCPKCGHATVDRVPVTVDSETGQMTVHDNRRRRNLQGQRYSVPDPKGGRHRGPIFAEDELMMGGRMREVRRAQKLLAKEKLAHDPFGGATGNENQWCQRHVTASGNHINQFEAKIVVGYGRRNPNANNFHKHTGNKKKRR